MTTITNPAVRRWLGGIEPSMAAKAESILSGKMEATVSSMMQSGVLRRSPDGFVTVTKADLDDVLLWVHENVTGGYRLAEVGPGIMIEFASESDAVLLPVSWYSEGMPACIDTGLLRDLPWNPGLDERPSAPGM